MSNLPVNIKNVLNDKSLNMKQKLVAFLMFMDPKILPNNDKNDFHDLGVKIKDLINEKKIMINGFNKNFEIQVLKM